MKAGTDKTGNRDTHDHNEVPCGGIMLTITSHGDEAPDGPLSREIDH